VKTRAAARLRGGGAFLTRARASPLTTSRLASAADAPSAGGGGGSPDGGGAARYKVYTRTGDRGRSSLFNGERRSKADDVFAALGDVDELNSAVGVAAAHAAGLPGGGEPLLAQLAWVQSRLLDVGSAVATPPSASRPDALARVAFPPSAAGELEAWIDAFDATLPPLVNFILPSGGLAAAHLHVARTVCRRAERAVVTLEHLGGAGGPPPVPADDAAPTVEPAAAAAAAAAHPVPVFLNRLSDYLFVAARWAAARAGAPETVYKKAEGGAYTVGTTRSLA